MKQTGSHVKHGTMHCNFLSISYHDILVSPCLVLFLCAPVILSIFLCLCDVFAFTLRTVLFTLVLLLLESISGDSRPIKIQLPGDGSFY